jgi:hypothetical protein
MKKFNGKRWAREKDQAVSRRQSVHFERFMQERADVFQVTEGKAQAMFWAMS